MMRSISLHMVYIFHPHAGFFLIISPPLRRGNRQSGATSMPRSTLTHTRGTYACTRMHATCVTAETTPLSGQWRDLDRASSFFVYQRTFQRFFFTTQS